MNENYKNQIYFSDNLPILKQLKTGSINLIYIDPPFNTGKRQSRTQIRAVKSQNGNRKGFKGDNYETFELGTKEYEDDFGEKFIDEFIKPRLIEAYRILTSNGSLYFHIDYREVHYCKILLDNIFGRDCFINEIIWAYDYGGKTRTRWPPKHDNILFYVKNPNDYIFNSHLIDREPYMAPGLVGPEKVALGKLPTDTWWHTIVGTKSKERTGYPTQKPLRIIDRIIQASSLPGQVVLDFFAGSGTVGESCIKLGRNFILIDNNPIALEVMARRFAKSPGIRWVNFDPEPFQTPESTFTASKDNKNPSEFEMLASLAMYIRNDIEEQNEIWESSPFEWVPQLPAAKKGKLGKNLIASWCAAKGLSINYPKDKRANLIINGNRIATKFSSLWADGSYKFQQIRNNGYDYLICLGISPSDAHCWVFKREFIIEKALPQHSGSKGAEYWLSINPEIPPEWTKECGGSLTDAYLILKNLKKKS
jgi:site-specific DNA-methyltransferase (adenine-specific)